MLKKSLEKSPLNSVVIYQTKSGAIELRADAKKETIWANLNQMADLFETDKSGISRHVRNILESGELSKRGTVAKIATVQKEGRREVVRTIEMYSLDMVIAVGYRVNSKNATQFRIWATKVLKEFLTKGFVINRKQIQKNYQEFLKTVESIQDLLPERVALDPKSILDLIKEFSTTWVSLDKYDKEELRPLGVTKTAIKLDGDELLSAILNLRTELISKGEATKIFAQERDLGSVAGIVGNVMQLFGGQSVYKTAEEKAAHLLYFMVKNHPFVDGNKRSGAFAFIWFLHKAKIKTLKNINPNALTALTLLVAESDPKKKDQIIALITQLLR